MQKKRSDVFGSQADWNNGAWQAGQWRTRCSMMEARACSDRQQRFHPPNCFLEQTRHSLGTGHNGFILANDATEVSFTCPLPYQQLHNARIGQDSISMETVNIEDGKCITSFFKVDWLFASWLQEACRSLLSRSIKYPLSAI